ncbi:MAG: helix-turn-helix domain-containing protein [Anaerolineae bacterium]
MVDRTRTVDMFIPWQERDMLPDELETWFLMRLADHPANFKSAQRAKFLLMYAAGESRETILDTLNVGIGSLQRWWRRWCEDGIEGVLYPNANMAMDLSFVVDPQLRAEIQVAIWRVRGLIPSGKLERIDARSRSQRGVRTVVTQLTLF